MSQGAPASTFGRVLSGLPDLVTAGFFVAAWIAPGKIGPEWIKTMMLVMLFEFITIHATAFMIGFAEQKSLSRLKRALGMATLGLAYLAMAAAFSAIFDEWWPVYAFLWLLCGKILGLWSHQDDTLAYSQALWGASTGFFILAVIAGALLPIPALMITDAVRAQAAIPGSGLWVDDPQRLLFSGAAYFFAVFGFKLTRQ